MRLEFRVLGDMQVSFHGAPIDVGHARQQCVLAVLLVDANRPVQLDQLIDRVWDDRGPQRARAAVYTYLSRLRRVLPASEVDLGRRGGGYVLATDPAAVDLHRFADLVRRARAAEPDPAGFELWERALALWRGDAFASLDTRWMSTVRADLDRQRWAAQLDRNDLALQLGHHVRLVAELSAAGREHPLDERLAGQLMLALYRCGRPSEALTHYDRTRRLLADELGTDPSPPLRDLHHQILTNQPGLRAPAPGVVAVATSAHPRPPTQLPADVATFTGRAEELARLDALLDAARHDDTGSGEATAVVISAMSGTAGVGKTSLAVRWAHRVRDAFPDGQLYVNLRGYDPQQPMPPADALAGFLYALGVAGHDIPMDIDSRAALYRSEVSGRRMLMVLDNASDVEQVRPLLPGTRTCSVVVTSRNSLSGLVAVHGAERLDLDVLPVPDALTLLRALIGDRVDADPAAALALADRCVRLPLALRIVAEYAAGHPALGLAELVDELADQRRRLDLLDAGDPRASVRAVFSWSYRHLPADAARVFRFLGLHPGMEISEYAAAALTGSDLPRTSRALVALARAHLIQPTGRGRYGMHDLLRAYAAERVSDEDEAHRRAALTRLFDHYLSAANAAMDRLAPDREPLNPGYAAPDRTVPPLPDKEAARAWLDLERANLVAICGHTARHGWCRHTVGLARTLSEYLEAGGHYASALSIYTGARDAAHRLGDRHAESEALWGLGNVQWLCGDPAKSIDHHRKSRALCRQLGDRTGEAHALTGLGRACLRIGQHHRAGRHLRRALTIFREVDDPGEVYALSTLGSLYGRQARFSLAHEHFHAALTSCRRVGNRVAEMHTLQDLAMLCTWHGPYDEAAEYIELAAALARQLHHDSGETTAMIGLGIVHTRRGHLDEAVLHLRRALARCHRMGFRTQEIRALYNLGIAYERQGHLDQAAEHLQRAVAWYRQTGEEPGVADALHALGVVHTRGDRPEIAMTNQHDAIAIFQQINHPAGQALARNGLGEALYAAGQTHQARDEHATALAVAVGIVDRHEQARAHSGIARICQATGDPTQARRHWEAALDLYASLRSPEAPVVRTNLAALADE